MRSTNRISFFVLCAVLILNCQSSLPQIFGQDKITPNGKFVEKMVRPAVGFLRKKYNKQVDYGTASLIGLTIFNSELRLTKRLTEISDPILKEILERVSVEVLRITPETEQSVFSACVTGILLAEVDRHKYDKQIRHVLEFLYSRQLANGGWGDKDDPTGDTSQVAIASQFLWLAREARFRVKYEVVEGAIKYLIANQHSSGGFTHKIQSKKVSETVTQSATAAGLASIYLLADTLGIRAVEKGMANDKSKTIRVADVLKAKQRGDEWLRQNLDINRANWAYANPWCLERYYSFKERSDGLGSSFPEWYVDGAKFLKSEQDEEGFWKNPNSDDSNKEQVTCYATLFLVRGTKLVLPKPIVFERGARKLPSKGPLEDPQERGDRIDRWRVLFTCSSSEAYTKQLDFFGIELGSVSKDSNLIEYASDFSNGKPRYSKGIRADEKRLVFLKPEDSPVLNLDKELLKAAGATTTDRSICSFYPARLIKDLERLEERAAQQNGKELKDVKQVGFVVSQNGGEFKFDLRRIIFH